MQNDRQLQDLIAATRSGDENRVRSIVTLYSHLADATVEGIPMVRFAACCGQRAVARALVDLGARVDLFSAAAIDNADRLAMLLRGVGEGINAHSDDGWTPLHLAARCGAIEATRLLLARGADVTRRSANACAYLPLHAAAQGGRVEILEMLLDRRADIDAEDAYGWTPLHVAAQHGDIAPVRYLLRRGANPGVRNNAGQTAAQVAEQAGYDRIAALFPS